MKFEKCFFPIVWNGWAPFPDQQTIPEQQAKLQISNPNLWNPRDAGVLVNRKLLERHPEKKSNYYNVV